MKNEAFKKFYSKLKWEGFLRALLCGLVIGFAVLLVSTTIFWIAGFKGYWLGIVLFVITVAAATSLFYFLRFSPNTKKMARRIDELGLEERMITMTELEGVDSFIAVKQREDAMATLGKVNASAMKLIISVPVIIACVAVGFGAAGMTTVHALNVADVVPSAVELVQGEQPDIYYNIAYSVSGEGVIYGVPNGDKNFIDGKPQEEDNKTNADKGNSANKDDTDGKENADNEGNSENKDKDDNAENKNSAENKTYSSNKKNQKAEVYNVKVKAGEKSDSVIAVANEGYVFVGWSDGYDSPYRTGMVINENKICTAIFQSVSDAEEKADAKDDTDKGEKPEDTPKPDEAEALKTSGEEKLAELLRLAVGANGSSAVALAGGGSGGGAGGGFSIGDAGSYGGPNGGGSGNGNGNGSGSGDDPSNGNGNGNGDGAGWQDNSASKQIINGRTYYGDLYEEAYKDMMAYLESEDVPDYIKKIIKDYFDTIAV